MSEDINRKNRKLNVKNKILSFLAFIRNNCSRKKYRNRNNDKSEHSTDKKKQINQSRLMNLLLNCIKIGAIFPWKYNSILIEIFFINESNNFNHGVVFLFTSFLVRLIDIEISYIVWNNHQYQYGWIGDI